MWTGLVWLRIGTGGKLLWIRYWTFGFHKLLANYRVSKKLGISQVVLSSMELVSCAQSEILTCLLAAAIYRQQKVLSHFPVCCWIDWLLMIKKCLIESGPPCICEIELMFLLEHTEFYLGFHGPYWHDKDYKSFTNATILNYCTVLPKCIASIAKVWQLVLEYRIHFSRAIQITIRFSSVQSNNTDQ
jgi:hypothetical protein